MVSMSNFVHLIIYHDNYKVLYYSVTCYDIGQIFIQYPLKEDMIKTLKLQLEYEHLSPRQQLCR